MITCDHAHESVTLIESHVHLFTSKIELQFSIAENIGEPHNYNHCMNSEFYEIANVIPKNSGVKGPEL